MKFLAIALPVTAVASFAAPAMAATSVVDGDCVSVAHADGCLFNGNINSNNMGGNSYLLAQSAYNTYNDTHPTANPDIVLNILFSSDDMGFPGSLTGGGGSSGTWSTPGFLVDFLAVKASNNFVLYKLAAPASSGSWDTFDIPFRNNPHDLSHLVFFGGQGPAVPEPATWALMLAGFGIAGGSIRYRRRRMSVTYA